MKINQKYKCTDPSMNGYNCNVIITHIQNNNVYVEWITPPFVGITDVYLVGTFHKWFRMINRSRLPKWF